MVLFVGNIDFEMEGEQELSIMKCKLLSTQVLTDVLNVLLGSDKTEQVRLDFSDTGISFHVTDKTKSFQTSSHIASTMFDEYTMEGQTDSVTCNLEPFSKCVSIFGNSMLLTTTLQMMYYSNEKCIKLVLDENEMHSECQIRTLSSMEEVMDYAPLFTEEDIVMGAVVDPNALKCTLNEVEAMKRSSEVELSFHPEGGICVSCSDESLTYDGYIDHHSTILSEFHCKDEKSWKYSRPLFLRCGKALSGSAKTFIRVNGNGIVCIQHLINDDAESPLFVDCFLHPLDVVE